MIYNHFSELPIDAFKPSFGSMKLYGGGNPVSDVVNSVSDAVSNVGDSISNTVSNAAQDIGSVGNQIDQSVNSAVPGGWATVGAAALAAVTMGGSLAADGAVGAADAAATAAPAELDATGTLAATAADTGAGGAGANRQTGERAAPPVRSGAAIAEERALFGGQAFGCARRAAGDCRRRGAAGRAWATGDSPFGHRAGDPRDGRGRR